MGKRGLDALARDRDQGQALVSTEMNRGFP
jgi:hypothetical protein